jgi:uncharacterized membrane protein
MGIAFDAPLALLLLPPLLAVVVGLHLASRRRLGVWRRRAALGVRVLLLTSLVAALAGLQLVLPVDRLAVVYVVDMSDSVDTQGREESLAYLRESLAAREDDDIAGIVAFGADALVERLPAELAELDRLASTPVKGATDIGAALRLAGALFPDDAQKRIVLLSDGNDTTGAGQTEAALAAARGIVIETRTTGLGGGDEVVVERLTAPTTARLGETIEVVAEIRSTVGQPAVARLVVDGVVAGSVPVDLAVGVTRVTFAIEPEEPGFHTFRVVVEAARDTFDQNDRADAHTIIKGEPRILVAAGDADAAAAVVGALEAQGQLVDTFVPELIPEDLPGLAAYDSVVLVDVPRLRLSDRQLAALQVYVRDVGRGLVAIGGPNAYGAGGYAKTPLEETLPVDMGVRDREKQPDVALVVVIDQSGSMDACHCNPGGNTTAGPRKTDIGKEAILRAAAALTARDQLGVVAFNEAAHWVVKTAPLGGLDDLSGSLAAIRPEGQTNIYAGLVQAVESLEDATATRRHIILLTDGWSSSGRYEELLGRMKAAGITLSTVGAGAGSATVLQELARQGGGRFYDAVNASSIPDIFLKETEQVAGQQIVEERFFPIQTGSSPILRGLEAGLPALLGYNGTTAKPAANTVLVSDRDDPVLAQWQYGLGRSVAWTSDATGRWASSWLGWDGFARFFSQAVAWTFPGDETAGIDASFETVDGKTRLRVESTAEDGSPRDFYDTSAALVGGADLETVAVDLVQVAPGVYEAPVGELDSGAYLVRITQTRPGTTPLQRIVGLVAPTPAEYRQLGENAAILAALRSATGGGIVATAEDPWVHDLAVTTSLTELWPLLLVLALLLWPLDIALRRVSVGRRELAAGRAWLGALPARRTRVAARTAAAAGMLATRERTGDAARRAILERPPDDGDAVATTSATTARADAAPTGPAGPPVPGPAPVEPEVEVRETADTIERLRAAKRRAAER